MQVTAGSMLMLVATTIDGFNSTDTAALFAAKPPEAMRVGYWMIQAMAGVALIDIARVAWVRQLLAAVAWAYARLREGGLARIPGVVGKVSGGRPAHDGVRGGWHPLVLVQAIRNLTAARY